jgi:hypothetical protein
LKNFGGFFSSSKILEFSSSHAYPLLHNFFD